MSSGKIILLLAFAGNVGAQETAYICEDASGIATVTNKPCEGLKREEVKRPAPFDGRLGKLEAEIQRQIDAKKEQQNEKRTVPRSSEEETKRPHR